jgi:two-component system, OmpR family, sensor histidine kinase PhoQ
MAAPASLGRKLVLSVSVPLALFFALTLVVLDVLFQNLEDRSLQDLLEQDVVALVSALEQHPDGELDVRVLDPESRLLTPGSGRYAQVQDSAGRVLWRSPSLTGVDLDMGGPVPAGRRASMEHSGTDRATARVYCRGLRWESAPGHSLDLTFSVAESTAPWRSQLLVYRSTLVGWFTLMALLLLAVLWWRMRATLQPIRRLEAEIGEVETGARDELGAGYPRELAGTAQNLNTLLHAERQRIARYRDSLGSLAHELKTPLAVIRASLQQGSSVAAGINREIDRMSSIVDRQLARAGGSAGVTIGQAPVAVAPMAQELRAALLKVHSQRDIDFSIEVEPGASFSGDPGDLMELLGNLLDNACKWCRGRVRLQALVTGAGGLSSRLCLRVSDDGPGVAPADRERILQRGVRASDSAGGHGIGLALVSDTVALYGGEITVTQSAELGGARFDVMLPGKLQSG